MTPATRWRLMLALAVIVMVPAVEGREPLELRARPAFAFAPAELQLEFRIVPDASNRSLEVIAESYDFYRSSSVQLEGERAQKLVAIRYHGLPAGDYSVRGVLIDEKGRERAMVERLVTVMTSGGEH